MQPPPLSTPSSADGAGPLRLSPAASDAPGGVSVLGLRDRLLREARSERQRCLEVAEAAERQRTDARSSPRGTSEVGAQTDPVVVLGGDAAGAAARRGVESAGVWTDEDDDAQAEALRTIALLGERCGQSRQSEGLVVDLEEQLKSESAARQELDAQVAHERSRKEAAQQQVQCLEYELDGKEAALQVAEKALERRDADLQEAHHNVRSWQDAAASTAGGYAAGAAAGGDDARYRALMAQLLDRERQLELKDQHISRLLTVLRQHRGIFDAEDAAALGGELPAALTSGALASIA